jgi:hypothetical protein
MNEQVRHRVYMNRRGQKVEVLYVGSWYHICVDGLQNYSDYSLGEAEMQARLDRRAAKNGWEAVSDE